MNIPHKNICTAVMMSSLHNDESIKRRLSLAGECSTHPIPSLGPAYLQSSGAWVETVPKCLLGTPTIHPTLGSLLYIPLLGPYYTSHCWVPTIHPTIGSLPYIRLLGPYHTQGQIQGFPKWGVETCDTKCRGGGGAVHLRPDKKSGGRGCWPLQARYEMRGGGGGGGGCCPCKARYEKRRGGGGGGCCPALQARYKERGRGGAV